MGIAQWLPRPGDRAGNLAAAVAWYLACDPAPLPHLFRILWPFWSMRDHEAEGRIWVGQMLPAAGSLPLQAQAELGLGRRAAARRRLRRILRLDPSHAAAADLAAAL